jgi:hypothetical protein
MNTLVERLREVLRNAQKERPNRPAYVNREFEWVGYEREVMFNAVNAERAKLGRTTICPSLVCIAENAAVGHTDYVEKFALYCAELVLDTP